MEIRLVQEPLSEEELTELANAWHGFMVKGAADTKRGVIALGGDWHMDANVRLIEEGASQGDVWGFSVYPQERGSAALDFVSLINIRPAQGNREQELHDETLREIIRELVKKYLPFLSI